MTLSTLENKLSPYIRKRSLALLGISAFVALFGQIYEIFSHGVWSSYMTGAFLYPLVACLLWTLLGCFADYAAQSRSLRFCADTALATLTVGSILKGVFVIYGTEVTAVEGYFYIGWALTAAVGFIFIYKILKRKLAK